MYLYKGIIDKKYVLNVAFFAVLITSYISFDLTRFVADNNFKMVTQLNDSQSELIKKLYENDVQLVEKVFELQEQLQKTIGFDSTFANNDIKLLERINIINSKIDSLNQK